MARSWRLVAQSNADMAAAMQTSGILDRQVIPMFLGTVSLVRPWWLPNEVLGHWTGACGAEHPGELRLRGRDVPARAVTFVTSICTAGSRHTVCKHEFFLVQERRRATPAAAWRSMTAATAQPAAPAADAAQEAAATAAVHEAHMKTCAARLEQLLARHAPSQQTLPPAPPGARVAQPSPGLGFQPAAGGSTAQPETLEARVAAKVRQLTAQMQVLSTEELRSTITARCQAPSSCPDGRPATREELILHLAEAVVRAPPVPAAQVGAREACMALPPEERDARMVANGVRPAPPGRAPVHTCDAMGALLTEVLVGQVASVAPPQLPSICFTAGQLGWLRQLCQGLMVQHNGLLPPVGTVLSQTPGAAAVVAAARCFFGAAWARYGDAAVADAHRRGAALGARAQLVRAFAQRMVAAGHTPGVPEARTWGHVLGLAAGAGEAAAAAVKLGSAMPLELVPALAPSVLGCAPGTPEHAALAAALGPYGLFARSPTPAELNQAALWRVHAPGCTGVSADPDPNPGTYTVPDQRGLVRALLREFADAAGQACATPQSLGSLFIKAGSMQEVRETLAEHYLRAANADVPAGVPLEDTPGAAMLVSALRVAFLMAWATNGTCVSVAAEHGELQQALRIAAFARRALAGNYVPGWARGCATDNPVPVPHTVPRPTADQGCGLVQAAADGAFSAVSCGSASALSLCPALPPDVIGGAPGSPAAAALMRALGPYALFARQQTPGYWAAAAAQPARPCTLSIPPIAAAMYGFSTETLLPPHPAACAPRASPDPGPAQSTGPNLSPACACDLADAAAAQARSNAGPGPVPVETEGPGSPACEPALAVGQRRIKRGSAARSRWMKCAASQPSHACRFGGSQSCVGQRSTVRALAQLGFCPCRMRGSALY